MSQKHLETLARFHAEFASMSHPPKVTRWLAPGAIKTKQDMIDALMAVIDDAISNRIDTKATNKIQAALGKLGGQA